MIVHYLGLASVLAAAAVAEALRAGRKVPPLLGIAPVAFPLVVQTLLAWLLWPSVEPTGALASWREETTSAFIASAQALTVIDVVTLPAAIVLLVGAATTAWRGRWSAKALIVPGILLGLMEAVHLFWSIESFSALDPHYALRLAVTPVLGGLALVAFAAQPPEPVPESSEKDSEDSEQAPPYDGTTGSPIAGGAFVLAIASVLTAQIARDQLRIHQQVTSASDELAPQVWAAGQATLSGAWGDALIALALASCLATLAIGPARAAGRTLTSLAVVWIPVGWVSLAVANPSARVMAALQAGKLAVVPEEIALPRSTSQLPAGPSTVLQIQDKRLFLDGQLVTGDLYEAMEGAAAAAGSDNYQLLVVADRTTPYRQLMQPVRDGDGHFLEVAVAVQDADGGRNRIRVFSKLQDPEDIRVPTLTLGEKAITLSTKVEDRRGQVKDESKDFPCEEDACRARTLPEEALREALGTPEQQFIRIEPQLDTPWNLVIAVLDAVREDPDEESGSATMLYPAPVLVRLEIPEADTEEGAEEGEDATAPSPKAAPKPKPKPKPKPAPDPKDDGKDESKPKEEAKPAPKEEAKPAPKEEAKPAPKEEAEPAPKEEAKPAPKEEAKPAPKEEAKPAPEEEAEPAPKEEAKPAPKEEAKPGE